MNSNCCCSFLVKFAKKIFVSYISRIAALIVTATLITLFALFEKCDLLLQWDFSIMVLLPSAFFSFIFLAFTICLLKLVGERVFGIVLIIYGVLILILVTVFHLKREKVVNEIDDFLNNCHLYPYCTEKENHFKCCGTEFCNNKYPENCHDKIDYVTRKILMIITISFIVLVVLIWISAVFCFIKVRSNEEIEYFVNRSELESPVLDECISDY